MSNINFTCPHCSYTTQLASSTEGMKGNCPSCKAEVVITPDNPESEWLVMSSGLKSETPTKLKDSEIIALIRDETIAGGAQLSNLSKPSGEWISLKDSHFYQYVEELETEKKRQREKEKEEKLAQKTLAKKERAEEKQRQKERAEEKQRQIEQQTDYPVEKTSQPKNWIYKAIKSDLTDDIMHTFRTTSISGTDKYGQPIDLFVRFGSNTRSNNILIDWKGTCFADAPSCHYRETVAMRCGSAEMGASNWGVTNDLTGTILGGERADYCVRSFFAIERAVFSVQAYHDNRIDAVFDVSGLFQAIQSTVPNPKPGVLPISTYPHLAHLPETVDHGWVRYKWVSPKIKKKYADRRRIAFVVLLIAAIAYVLANGL